MQFIFPSYIHWIFKFTCSLCKLSGNIFKTRLQIYIRPYQTRPAEKREAALCKRLSKVQ